jgi:hypothetical protein
MLTKYGLGPFCRDVIAVDPLEPWGIASAAYRLELLARAPVPGRRRRLVTRGRRDLSVGM